MKNSVLLFVLCGLWGCSEPVPDKIVSEGAENEPERQQMQRQLRPPFLDPLGEGDTFHDLGILLPIEEGRRPYPVKTILITDRTESSISLRWHDRSSVEESNLLRRRQDNSSTWQDALTYGPVSGFNDVIDVGLEPDLRYCYQLVSSNEHGDSYSPQRCAYTKSDIILPLYRAQLRVKTADISKAGTNNKVRVRLNAAPGGLTVPFGNVTVMDYGQNDFERKDDFIYDLELSEIENFSDITMISLSKDGSNGLCVEYLELKLNNLRVFNRDFRDSPEGCQWLDDSNGHSNTYSIFSQSLRAHSDWQNFGPTVQQSIDRKEIESRIEGLVGHLFSEIPKAKWGDRKGRAWVEATYRSDDTVHINLDMEGVVPYWFNSDIDIDFDLTFRMIQESDQWKLDLTTSNFEVSVDFDWFTNTMGFILPCGPVISIVLDEGIPDCITYLEGYIEKRIDAGWQPIARSFFVNNSCLGGFRPMAIVTETPDVEFSCIEIERVNLPDIQVIQGTNVISRGID